MTGTEHTKSVSNEEEEEYLFVQINYLYTRVQGKVNLTCFLKAKCIAFQYRL